MELEYYAFSKSMPIYLFGSVLSTPENLSNFRAIAQQIHDMRHPVTTDAKEEIYPPDDIDDRQIKMLKKFQKVLRDRAIWSASVTLEEYDFIDFKIEDPHSIAMHQFTYHTDLNLYTEEYPHSYGEMKGSAVFFDKHLFKILRDRSEHPDKFVQTKQLFDALEMSGPPKNWRLIKIWSEDYSDWPVRAANCMKSSHLLAKNLSSS